MLKHKSAKKPASAWTDSISPQAHISHENGTMYARIAVPNHNLSVGPELRIRYIADPLRKLGYDVKLELQTREGFLLNVSRKLAPDEDQTIAQQKFSADLKHVQKSWNSKTLSETDYRAICAPKTNPASSEPLDVFLEGGSLASYR